MRHLKTKKGMLHLVAYYSENKNTKQEQWRSRLLIYIKNICSKMNVHEQIASERKWPGQTTHEMKEVIRADWSRVVLKWNAIKTAGEQLLAPSMPYQESDACLSGFNACHLHDKQAWIVHSTWFMHWFFFISQRLNACSVIAFHS